MSEALVPTITQVGFAACRNAQGTGLLATISAIGIGTGIATTSGPKGYSPTGRETALKTERARVPLLSGSHLGGINGGTPLGFRVLADVPPLAAGIAPYPVNEVGIFLSDGTLLCVWSDPDLILQYMTSRANLEVAFDLFLDQLPVSSMTLQVQRPDIPDTIGVLAELLAASASHFIAQLKDEWRLPLKPRAGS